MKHIALLTCLLPMVVQADEMTLYQFVESDLEPYPQRLIVNENYLRMDEGEEGDNYVLLDRQSGTIYSVTHEDKTILVIEPVEVTIEQPAELEVISREVRQEEALPEVAGRVPRYMAMEVNDRICYQVVALEAVQPETVAALRQFASTMAGEHARVLAYTPADVQDECDMAVNIYHPGWPLQYGLPIQEWDAAGNGRVLADFTANFNSVDQLFKLPTDYERYTP